MRNLSKGVRHIRVMNRDAGTAGTKKATILDTQGFESVRFVVAFQTVVNNAVVTFQIAHGDVNNTSNMDVTTAKVGPITSDGTTIALSNKELVLEVVGPLKRYLEAQVVIADQNAPIDGIFADLYPGPNTPVSQGSTVHASALSLNPATA